ncbi:hypothetical protein EB093_04130 [bacterium]|nr:hypothetical protein [bacterium]
MSYGANSGVQLADKILQLYADRDQVAIMSNNAEAVYIEHFEYAKVMASFENYLKKVVDNRAALADGE